MVRSGKNLILDSQKQGSIGDLADIIAHDFNNILAGIMGNSDLILADPEYKKYPELLTRINTIVLACETAKNLVSKVLLFNRKKHVRKELIDLSQVIADISDLLSAILTSRINLAIHMDGKPCLILGNKTQIHQVLINLSANAAQAIKNQGKIAIVLKSHINPGDEQPMIRLTVCDTGCGMSAKTLKRVFEPYFTTKAKQSGTGLGMALVHDIVDKHNGSINISSRLGKGTVVNIDFPCASRISKVRVSPKNAG